MTDKIVILVTCKSVVEGKQIARALVEERLAACVNILEAPVRSIYRWKGEIESAAEYLLLIKSAMPLFRRVRRRVQELHSYEAPEIIALPIVKGSRAYLAWLRANLRDVSIPPQKSSRKNSGNR